MKRLLLLPALGAGLVLAQDTEPPVQVAKAIPVAAQPPAPKVETSGKEAVDDSPSPLPALDHYAKLWTDSLFTTRALPAPDVPAGPNFTDNLTLVGTVEDKGKLTATLIDKTTSGVVQAFIGADNSEGYRISKVEMSDAKEVKRIQLQKGNQIGWLSFGEAAPAAGGNDPTAALNAGGSVAARPGNIPPIPQPQPTLFPAGSAPAPAGLQNVPRAMQAMPVIPPQPANAAPAMRTGLPDAPPSLPGDPPLPPP
jgi:hypothetical protein